MRTVRLVLIGFGNVGRALARLILSKDAELQEAHALSLKIVGIGTGSHGAAANPEGLDLSRALQLIEAGRNLQELSCEPVPADSFELLHRVGAEALLESIPVDYHAGEPAIRFLTTALERGMHAITANKGPVVHAYDSLHSLAQRSGRHFRFESAVMDGAPVFSLWRECLPGARLQSFRGVLNSTTNLILSLMEEGTSFDAAVVEAQRLGIAESDPSGDIEGWDAAIKVAALATVLMGVPTRIQDVQRKGIGDLTSDAVRQAAAAGRRWKLVCSAVRKGASVQARVGPESVDPSDPIYHIMGTSSGVTFKSDVLGDLTITETDPGPDTTAYGLLADLLGAIQES